MGIIGRLIANKVDEDILMPVAGKLLEIPAGLIEKREKKLREQTFKEIEGKKVLIVKHKVYEFKDKLNVYNVHKTLRYRISGSFFSLKRLLHIYNSNDKELGTVKEKLFAFRSPFSVDHRPANFDFIVDGQKVARLKTRNTYKEKLVLSNGWYVNGNIESFKCKIYDKCGKEQASISNKAYFADSPKNEEYSGCRIEYDENADELLILMIVLSIYIYNAPSKFSSFMGAAHNKPL